MKQFKPGDTGPGTSSWISYTGEGGTNPKGMAANL